MKIAVVGTGYVGLVAGAGFADFGNHVACVDVDAEKVDRLSRGEVPIYEPGLEDLVQRNLLDGRLRFTTDLSRAVNDPPADVIILAVGTPSRSDGSADTTQVLEAARGVALAISARPATHYTVVVNKSTVPVGTADRVARAMGEVLGPTRGASWDVASNPEFLKEGTAVADFMRPDRIVIGAETREAAETLADLYRPYTSVYEGSLLLMDTRSAELSKYACNAYLATRISFMNEVANLCDKLGADVDRVRRAMGTDPRIGKTFLFPGIGYGGSCFPKDVRALVHQARAAGSSLHIAEEAGRVNDEQKEVLPAKVLSYLARGGRGRTVAVWGLSFKPNTDDVREAPSRVLIDALLAGGCRVRAHDPAANAHVRALYGDRVELVDDMYQAADGADALALCTEWRQFRRPSYEILATLMRGRGLFDGRNAWDPEEARAAGFDYHGIGRPITRRDRE